MVIMVNEYNQSQIKYPKGKINLIEPDDPEKDIYIRIPPKSVKRVNVYVNKIIKGKIRAVE